MSAVRNHCYSGAQPKEGQHSENRWLVLQPLYHQYQWSSNLKVPASHLVILLMCRLRFGGPWWGISSVQSLSHPKRKDRLHSEAIVRLSVGFSSYPKKAMRKQNKIFKLLRKIIVNLGFYTQQKCLSRMKLK